MDARTYTTYQLPLSLLGSRISFRVTPENGNLIGPASITPQPYRLVLFDQIGSQDSRVLSWRSVNLTAKKQLQGVQLCLEAIPPRPANLIHLTRDFLGVREAEPGHVAMPCCLVYQMVGVACTLKCYVHV